MNPSRARRPHRAARAFTIIEVIVIVVILGVLAAVIAPRLINRIGQSRQALAQSNAASLANSMRLFMADHGLPEPGASIRVLWERPSNVEETKWQPFVDNADAILDPWGKEFILVIPGDRNVDFDIVSYGRDGQPGGADEDADIVKP